MNSSPVQISPPKIRPLSLAVALLIMIGGSIYPFAFAKADGSADHTFAMLIFWAMSAGLVNGVGFVPRWLLWRWIFSGWACLMALLLACVIRLA
ncbi:MAG: hypothetical protein AUJ20_07045 [Comamonadaceae bacterium CG1_02_60_18]|nr:MAG: hypothetical protein AUJ20_07045 [Comamonadaceae bacterium CG1_02_60_18]